MLHTYAICILPARPRPRLLRRAGYLLLRSPPHRGGLGGPHRLRGYRRVLRGRPRRHPEQAEAVGAVGHHEIDARQRGVRPLRPLPDSGQRASGRGLPAECSCRADPAGAFGGQAAREIGARAVAHGSTGAGNDQVRFDVALRVLAPDLEIVTPIRDEGVTPRAGDRLSHRSQPSGPGQGRRLLDQSRTLGYHLGRRLDPRYLGRAARRVGRAAGRRSRRPGRS